MTGSQGIRNAAILLSIFGTGLTPSELAALRVADAVRENGELASKTILPAHVAYNGYERTIFWANPKLRSGMDDYLNWRVDNGVGVGSPGRFRGLDPYSALFINGRTGNGFAATGYEKGGVQRESAMVLSALIRQLLKQAGVDGNARSGRRSLAVWLGRQGKDPALVREMLGLRSITATKTLMQHDPVRMGDIVARAF